MRAKGTSVESTENKNQNFTIHNRSRSGEGLNKATLKDKTIY